MTIVFRVPPLEPPKMCFDMQSNMTWWEILANFGKDEFQIKLFPSVYAVFRYTGVMRLLSGVPTRVFVLDKVTNDFKLDQGQLVLLAGAFVLQQEVLPESLRMSSSLPDMR